MYALKVGHRQCIVALLISPWSWRYSSAVKFLTVDPCFAAEVSSAVKFHGEPEFHAVDMHGRLFASLWR